MVTKIKFSDFRSIIKCPCAPPFCGYCEPLSSSFQPHRFPLKSPTGRGFSPFPFLPSAGKRVTAIQFYLLVHIDIFYYGRGLGHTFGVRVDGTSSRRLWPPDGGRLCTRVVSPQGETTHYILCVAPLLHPLLSLTHWIFRSLMLPYKSSSHSAKCVRCASLLFRERGERALCSKSHKKRTPEGVLFFIPIRMRSSVRCPRCRQDLRCCRKLWLRSCSKRPVLRSSGVLRLRGLPRSVHRTSYPSRSPAGR